MPRRPDFEAERGLNPLAPQRRYKHYLTVIPSIDIPNSVLALAVAAAALCGCRTPTEPAATTEPALQVELMPPVPAGEESETARPSTGTAQAQSTVAEGSPADPAPAEVRPESDSNGQAGEGSGTAPAIEAQPGGSTLANSAAEIEDQDSSPKSATKPMPDVRRLAKTVTWEGLLERDLRLSFGPATALRAAADLERLPLDAEGRAVCLFALGSSSLRGGRELLESWASEGGTVERQGAILALGEMGSASVPFLQGLAEQLDLDLMGHIFLALVRSGERGRQAALDVSQSNARLMVFTGRLIKFADTPEDAGASPPVEDYLRWRWKAAKAYGLVDGQSFEELLTRSLYNDPDFLSNVVLRSAAKLSLPGVRDHIFEALREGQGMARLRAAVIAMPDVLGDLLQAGEWEPSGGAEWATILLELGLQRPGIEAYPLLESALSVPLVRQGAVELLLNMGDQDVAILVEKDLYHARSAYRWGAARALGSSGDRRWITDLARLREDLDVEVRSAALVAQLRLGYSPAEEFVRQIIASGEEEERDSLATELMLVSHDSRMLSFLEQCYSITSGDLRLRVATELTLLGRASYRDDLREALLSERGGTLAPRMVTALGQLPTYADIELLEALYPSEEGLELNVALGIALVKNSHPKGIAILRKSIWDSPWNQSVLAAGLLKHARGIAALRDELDGAPTPVTRSDLFRVGFAIGEWGGVRELEILAQRRPSGDPALHGAYLGAMSARTQ